MQDNRLADFTDRVLEGRATEIETGVDEELLGLEKTVLRLNQAFPAVSLDEAAVKQMQVRLNARMRREQREDAQPFWRRWFEPQFRLQFGMILIMMALVIVIVVSPISYTTAGSSMNATALTPTQGSVALALAGVIFVLLWIWIKRRK
jgi:hypothetical protein